MMPAVVTTWRINCPKYQYTTDNDVLNANIAIDCNGFSEHLGCQEYRKVLAGLLMTIPLKHVKPNAARGGRSYAAPVLAECKAVLLWRDSVGHRAGQPELQYRDRIGWYLRHVGTLSPTILCF
jgi:hypothetical protein